MYAYTYREKSFSTKAQFTKCLLTWAAGDIVQGNPEAALVLINHALDFKKFSTKSWQWLGVSFEANSFSHVELIYDAVAKHTNVDPEVPLDEISATHPELEGDAFLNSKHSGCLRSLHPELVTKLIAKYGGYNIGNPVH